MRAAASPAQPQRCGELCPARLSAATCSQPVAVAVKSVPASGRSAGQGFQGLQAWRRCCCCSRRGPRDSWLECPPSAAVAPARHAVQAPRHRLCSL